MMRRLGLLAFPVALLLVAPPNAVRAAYKQIPVVRHTVETEIAAPAAAVWMQLTQGKNLVTWCPVWQSALNAKVSLGRVGDTLDFTDQWGNGGRSIVTYLARGKELRVAHEPNDGSYLCQAKIVLTPKGNATRVQYVEAYTDESAPADLEATANKLQASMGTMLAALKKAAEHR